MKDCHINRRGFLKKAAYLGAGAVGFPYVIQSSALGKFGGVAASNRITLGCIGMGAQGTLDTKGFLEKDDVQVVAVCDVNKESGGYLGAAWGRWGESIGGREPAKRMIEEKYAAKFGQAEYKGCAGYNDFRELIARDDIDCVMTAVPDHWHGIIGVEVVRRGKDVYGQKPLAYTVAEGRAICDAVKRYGVVWQTGSQQRCDWNFRFAAELVRNGRIGKIETVRVTLPGQNRVHNKDMVGLTEICPVPDGFDYDMWLGPAPWSPYCPGRCHWNFRWISDYAGGQITDWAGHHCDIVQWAMGTDRSGPVEIEGRGKWPRDGLYDTVEDFRFECRYEQGFRLIVEGDNSVSGGIRFEGSDGWIYVGRRNKLEAEPASILRSSIGPDEIRLYRSKDHKQNFIDCIKTRSEPIAPAEVGQRSITIGHLGVISIKLGRKLRWDAANERFVNGSDANRLLKRSMRGVWGL